MRPPQPTTPAPATDGRIDSLPRPAVNLAQRLAQLANTEEFVLVHVVISKGVWNLQIHGRNEVLGKESAEKAEAKDEIMAAKRQEAYRILFDWIKSGREPTDRMDECWICFGGRDKPHESDCVYVRARNLVGFDVYVESQEEQKGDQCSNCKWWQRYKEEDDYYREGFGVCELAAGGVEPSGVEPKHKNTKAYAQDYEEYRAWLNTRYDFGCNQWEKKDE